MKIHFIGIGGIGVSALAQHYLHQRHEISGSDLAASEITDALAKKDVVIRIGNKAEHIQPGIDLVIHSPAVKPDNPEYQKAKKLGIKTMSYPEALGQLTKEYFTIAISGSHGKSTTTALVALILVKAGIDPTVIIGTKLAEFSDPDGSASGGGTNFRAGKSKYLAIEACEYDSSFTNYYPQITVVANIDKEHMDYFKTFANELKIFKEFITKLPASGFLVFNNDDANLRKISRGKFSAIQYSLKQKEAVKIKKLFKVPGKHNISNALAALTVARILGISDAISFKALSEFKGSWRRFEIIKEKPYTIISDYAHHPNEILATLTAAREKYPKKTIWLIFQPHQYQRTFYLLKDFVKVFRKVKIDHIIITDIYDVAGREEKTINQKVSSEMLVKKINKKNVQYMPLSDAETFVKHNIRSGEVLIIMGAGNIYKSTENF